MSGARHEDGNSGQRAVAGRRYAGHGDMAKLVAADECQTDLPPVSSWLQPAGHDGAVMLLPGGWSCRTAQERVQSINRADPASLEAVISGGRTGGSLGRFPPW